MAKQLQVIWMVGASFGLRMFMVDGEVSDLKVPFAAIAVAFLFAVEVVFVDSVVRQLALFKFFPVLVNVGSDRGLGLLR